MGLDDICEVAELLGKTITKINNDEGEIRFYTEDGSEYLMFHDQD